MRQLKSPQLVPAEYRRQVYLCTLDHGTTEKDLLEPSFWAHVAANLRPLDRIDCWWEDGSRYTELLVVKSTRTETRVVVITDKKITDGNTTADIAKELGNYSVDYAGPSVGYRVVRKSDNQTIRSDVRWNEADAMGWLMEHLAQPHPTAGVAKKPEPKAQTKPQEKAA